ncbi:MAG: hypothetical protein ACI8RH_000840 [Flavobacteriales bacterium]|jgi:hypothetical protein
MKNLLPLFLIGVAMLCSCSNDDGVNLPAPYPEGFLGEIEFVKTFGGSQNDNIISVVQASDGGYVLMGSTESVDGDITGKSSTDVDFWLLKTTPLGEVIFNKVYGGSNTDIAASLINTKDGGFIVCGYSASNDGDVSGNEGFQDYWITKLDANGTITWEKNYGFAGIDQALRIIETTNGNFFTTGFFDVSASENQGNDDGKIAVPEVNASKNTLHGVGEFWGILMDRNGDRIWRRYFGGSNNDRSYDVVEAEDGGFFMIGSSESSDFDITDNNGSYDFWVVRVTANGDKVWTKSFGGSEIDQGYGITNTPDGNYIMVGDTRSTDGDVTSLNGNADAWVVKFAPNGDLIWQKTYGGTAFDSAKRITTLENGDFAIAGNTRSSMDGFINKGQNDAWVFIIDANGALKFTYVVGGANLDFANDVLQTQDNKLLVVGSSESNDMDIPENKGKEDALLIKIK